MVKENAESVPEVASVKGRGFIRGTVKYPSGAVSGAKITAGGRTATSDSTGKYEISNLDAGVYAVVAQAPFPGYKVEPRNVEITAAETKVVDIYLDFTKAAVEGHVYGREGKPIVGATLSGLFSGKDLETKTDEHGFFRFGGAAPGNCFIRANAPGYVGETRDFTAREDAVNTLDFRLTGANCRVYGIVTDVDGKPLQAEVLLMKSGIVTQKANSEKNTGHYEFPLLPGTYQIVPVAAGYEGKGWYGEISAATRVDFKLSPLSNEPKPITYRRVR